MGLVVQKFGGTSVNTPQAREALIRQVKKCKSEGNDVVVVVSAMGRKGDPYATDTFINLLEEINPNVAPRKKDLIMSCGEIISAALISHLLESNDVSSEPLTGFQAGILTTDKFGDSEIINIETSKIEEYLKNGKVIVIAGFQGQTINGDITTLGRGGSDTAAVAIGGYLKADRVDIFTDVPGVAKVDPRIVPFSTYIPFISYDNMYKLAEEGAKVIHPRAVKIAKEFNIPVRVRSTFTEKMGTLITDKNKKYEHMIIGMAIEESVQRENLTNKNTIGKIFILFNEVKKLEFEKELKCFLSQNQITNHEIIWGRKDITIFLPTDKLIEVTRRLYDYYHNNTS